jgi:hypothetical protein
VSISLIISGVVLVLSPYSPNNFFVEMNKYSSPFSVTTTGEPFGSTATSLHKK